MKKKLMVPPVIYLRKGHIDAAIVYQDPKDGRNQIRAFYDKVKAAKQKRT